MSSHIIVKPTLQIQDDEYPNVFAFGDVANTGGAKQARAAYMQSEIVLLNILTLIEGKDNLRLYKPNVLFEDGIKLTLGKARPCAHI
jgi:apoptosis-inducing factor 2